jgi:hypothetical protein
LCVCFVMLISVMENALIGFSNVECVYA